MATDQEMEVYDALKDVRRSVSAFGEMRNLIPEEDQYASLITCLTERLEADFVALQSVCFKQMSVERLNAAQQRTEKHASDDQPDRRPDTTGLRATG
ncbi:hypothetical protein [Marinobacterium iners]|uniref:Uncharacterized protein n=1 Tax=Marinobacterium iners DSM 11526 TaxID=1122198 RepID=A0A1H4H7L8_9GAMM|nr:hypothetical protein [Marinobacterium iners]SEB17784.1 hypothetical protein SAMN02745729_1319 [Marinobacterium iners DSM 11526]